MGTGRRQDSLAFPFISAILFKDNNNYEGRTIMIYKTKGTCSSLIEVELDGDIIKEVQFTGGCNGNLKGISQLVKGMKAADVIERMEGTTCGMKPTSCPDQLAKALKEALAQ